MNRQEALEVYNLAYNEASKKLDIASLSTDGYFSFDLLKEVSNNLLRYNHSYEEIMRLIKSDKKQLFIEKDLIEKIISLEDISIEDKLDLISGMYPRSVMVLGAKKVKEEFIYAKFRVKTIEEVFIIGSKEIGV